MLKLTKKEVKGSVAEYYYQPLCKGKEGLVSFDYQNFELTIIELAEFDDENDCIYITNCCWQLRDFFKSGNFPDQKITTW